MIRIYVVRAVSIDNLRMLPIDVRHGRMIKLVFTQEAVVRDRHEPPHMSVSIRTARESLSVFSDLFHTDSADKGTFVNANSRTLDVYVSFFSPSF